VLCTILVVVPCVIQDLRPEHVTLMLNRIVGTGKHGGVMKKSKFDDNKRSSANSKDSSGKISVRQFVTWVRTRQVSTCSSSHTINTVTVTTHQHCRA
jgi:hypothetical protein